MVFEIVQASTTPSEDLPCQRKLVESKERRACWYSLLQKMSWRTINVIRLSKAPWSLNPVVPSSSRMVGMFSTSDSQRARTRTSGTRTRTRTRTGLRTWIRTRTCP
jgi:hypothetical protein